MIQKSFGSIDLFITDSSFGHVGVGDETFLKRFESRFSFRPDHVVWMNQIHSPKVQWIDEVSNSVHILPATDGLVTRLKNVLLVTKTADCVPILLRNEEEKIIAAIHCGWRGFMAGVLEGFAVLCQQKNIPLEHFSAFLGPHLRVEHFEVQQDFIDQVPAMKKSFLEFRGEKIFYNLTKGVVSSLHSFGIQNIEDCGMDTYGNPEYFSYRHWSQQPEVSRSKDYNTFANCIIMR